MSGPAMAHAKISCGCERCRPDAQSGCSGTRLEALKPGCDRHCRRRVGNTLVCGESEGRQQSGIARLRALAGGAGQNEAKRGTTGLEAQSFLSFHPSLKRRLKRLERMGAHYSPEAHGKTPKTAVVVMTVLWLIIAPLLLAAAAMM